MSGYPRILNSTGDNGYQYSSDNSISANRITKTKGYPRLLNSTGDNDYQYSSDNSISANRITKTKGYARLLNSTGDNSYQYSSDNSISANRITKTKDEGLKGNNMSSNVSISDRVKLLYSKGLYTDVEFVLKCFKIPTKTIFPAHRNILAIGSPVFAKMLYSDPINSGQNFPLSISIENISYEAFGNVIEFLYTDDVHLEDMYAAAETLEAANKLEVPALVKHCENFLDSDRLSAENVCSVLEKASSLQIQTLKARCMKFIQQRTREVIQSDGFLGTSMTTLKAICNSEKLSLSSEVELFDALVQWAMNQKGSPMRRSLESLLKHVRFLTLPTAEFGALVKKYDGFFNETEALSIMLHLSNPRECKEIPKWCNRGQNRCFLLSSTFPVGVQQNKAQHGATSSIKNNDCFYKDENRIVLGLKPCYQPYGLSRPITDSFTSVLEIKCLRGRYAMKNIKLEFQKPVEAVLSISILVKPGAYFLRENLRIKKSDRINFMFKQKVHFGADNELYISVTARDKFNCCFMQFDPENSILFSDSPFVYNVSSAPSHYKYFFIREVNFENII